MSERVEQMFSQLRKGPWNADPMGVPQEGFGGNGNIESQGWIADDAITADTIQANAVTAGKVDADAITAREILANTITASEIAANTITASEIAANTITATEIAADAITTSELAANAVIAENITAGEVTSSKMVATITGKNFGANSGTAGAPGYFFDSDASTGLHWVGSIPFIGDIISVSVDGTQRARFSILGIGTAGNVEPLSDSTYNLGSSSNRWDTVYRISESAVSDVRRKTDIADAPLGLDFIQSLRPRVFRWKDASDTQARESAVLDTYGMARESAPYLRRIKRIRMLQQAGRVEDAAADSRVEEARAALTEIRRRYQRPVEEAQHRRRPGKRLHYGLIAQEVKAALDAAGVDSMDAAFWQESPEGDQALSYSELMIPLLRAVQELAKQVAELRRSAA